MDYEVMTMHRNRTELCFAPLAAAQTRSQLSSRQVRYGLCFSPLFVLWSRLSRCRLGFFRARDVRINRLCTIRRDLGFWICGFARIWREIAPSSLGAELYHRFIRCRLDRLNALAKSSKHVASARQLTQPSSVDELHALDGL